MKSLIFERAHGSSFNHAGPATRLIVVRHGRVHDDHLQTVYGQRDVPLGPVGWEQTRAAAKRLETLELDAVYSSDLSRAVELAKLIAEPRGLTPIEYPCFRERAFGEWEKLTWDQIRADYADAYRRYHEDLMAPVVPGGETYADLSERVLRRLDETLPRHRHKTIVLTAHMGTIRVIVANALGLPIEKVIGICSGNCQQTIVDYHDNGQAALRALGA